MEPEFFSSLIREFAHNERLGIASGSRFERENGLLRQCFPIGIHVEAQCRASRQYEEDVRYLTDQ
jgi:hypothetical protein